MIILNILLVFCLSSCSVMMAASQKRAPIEQLEKIENRAELIALGGSSIELRRSVEGETVELFSFPIQGSVTRAIVYGLLDMSTLGLWELAGTPLESYLGQDRPLLIQATLDLDERVQKLEVIY